MVLIVLRIDASVYAEANRPARPTGGSTTFDAELAQAFGAAVRALRTDRGIAQKRWPTRPALNARMWARSSAASIHRPGDHLQNRRCAGVQHSSADGRSGKPTFGFRDVALRRDGRGAAAVTPLRACYATRSGRVRRPRLRSGGHRP